MKMDSRCTFKYNGIAFENASSLELVSIRGVGVKKMFATGASAKVLVTKVDIRDPIPTPTPTGLWGRFGR